MTEQWYSDIIFAGLYEQLEPELRNAATELVQAVVSAMVGRPGSLERMMLARSDQQLTSRDWFAYFLEVWRNLPLSALPPGPPTDEVPEFPNLEAFRDDQTGEVHFRPAVQRCTATEAVSESASVSPVETIILDPTQHHDVQQERPPTPTIRNSEDENNIHANLIEALPNQIQAQARRLFQRLCNMMIDNAKIMEWLLRARQGQNIRAQDIFVYLDYFWEPMPLELLPSDTSDHNTFTLIEEYLNDATGEINWRLLPVAMDHAPNDTSPLDVNTEQSDTAQLPSQDDDNRPGPSTGAAPIGYRPPPQTQFSDSSDDDDDQWPNNQTINHPQTPLGRLVSELSPPSPKLIKRKVFKRKAAKSSKKYKSKEIIPTSSESDDEGESAPTPKLNRVASKEPRQVIQEGAAPSTNLFTRDGAPSLTIVRGSTSSPQPIKVKKKSKTTKIKMPQHGIAAEPIRVKKKTKKAVPVGAENHTAEPVPIQVNRNNPPQLIRVKRAKAAPKELVMQRPVQIKITKPKSTIQAIVPRRNPPARPRARQTTRNRIPCTEPNCDATFTRPGNMRRHVDEQHGDRDKKWKCKLCNREYGLERDITEHFKTKHSENPAEYPCVFCGRVFDSRQALRSHEINQHESSSSSSSSSAADSETSGTE